MKLTPDSLFSEIEENTIYGFSKTLSQIEWLLAAIVGFYLASVRPDYTVSLWILTFLYCVYIVVFHYSRWTVSDHQKKLLVTTGIMIFYITMMVAFTGKIGSPLVSLFYLVIVVASITLHMRIAFAEVMAISLICLLMAVTEGSNGRMPFNTDLFLFQLFPFWLVAYLTTMLAKEVFDAKKKVEHLSQTDSLTGLWNMRMFTIMAEREFLRVDRTQAPFAIIMLDADNLKPVNDNFGHQAGSKLIWHMGKIIKSNLRVTDLIARFGGDEFVMMLPDTEPAYAYMVAERIRSMMASSPLTLDDGNSVQVTMSLGVASYPQNGDTLKMVMAKADEALYFSKRNGKNRCTSYFDEMSSKDSDERI